MRAAIVMWMSVSLWAMLWAMPALAQTDFAGESSAPPASNTAVDDDALDALSDAEADAEAAVDADAEAAVDAPLELAAPEQAPANETETAAGSAATESRLEETAFAAPGDEKELSLAQVEEQWGQHLILGGHRFLVGAFLPSAIPASYLGVRAGLQYHSVPGFAQLPTLAGTSEQAVVLETLNVEEVIDFSIYLHDLLTIYGDAYGSARVGANIATLLGTGADYTYGGDLGVLVNVLRFDSFVLSARAQIGARGGQVAGIVGLFQDLNAIAENALSRVLENPQTNVDSAIAELNNSFRVATAALLTPFTGLSYGASVNAAIGLGRFVGLQATVGLNYDSEVYRPTRFDVNSMQAVTTRYQVDSLRPTFGAAVDLNLEPLYVPIAVMFEYLATPLQVEGSGDLAVDLEGAFEQLLALGLYYAGRSDLQLGLTGFTIIGQAPTPGADSTLSGNPFDVGAQFVFRYVW